MEGSARKKPQVLDPPVTWPWRIRSPSIAGCGEKILVGVLHPDFNILEVIPVHPVIISLIRGNQEGIFRGNRKPSEGPVRRGHRGEERVAVDLLLSEPPQLASSSISRSGYYDWLERDQSQRALEGRSD